MAKEEYIATIVHKHFIREDCFIVSIDRLAKGFLDKKTQIFTDEEGNTFAPMSNPWIAMSKEVNDIYDNIISMDEMKQVSINSNTTLDEVIHQYEAMCKNTPYFVGRKEDGSLFTAPIDVSQFSDESVHNEVLEDTDNNGDIMVDDLQQLLDDISQGKYTKEDLQSILESLQATNEDMRDVIEFIEEQLQENEEETENRVFSIKDVFQMIQKTIINQDEATLRILTAIVQSQYASRKKKEGILLIGEKGVGKTELMNLISKYTDIPIHRIDTTQLVPSNVVPSQTVGTTIEEELWNLYEECGKNIHKAEKAIILFEHVDSWINGEEYSDPSVLNIPIDFINGKTYDAYKMLAKIPRTVRMNTKNMIVVLEGTYVKKNDLGFLPNSKGVSTDKKKIDDDIYIPNSFVGKMNVIKLNKLDLDAMKKILTDSDQSAIKLQQDLFEQLGVKLSFTSDYITEVSNKVLRQDMGAHGLHSAVNHSLWRAFYEVQSDGDCEEVIVDKESVNDSNHYQLVKRKS